MNKISKNALLSAIMVILLYFMWPYFIDIVLGLFNIESNIITSLEIFTNFILLLIVICIYLDDLKKDFTLFKRKFKFYMKKNLGIWFISIILMALLGLIINIIIPNVDPANEIILIDKFRSLKILYALNVLLYFPIIEELVFKKTFKDLINSKWLFIIITGLMNAFFNIAFTAENALSYIWIIPNISMLCGLSYIYYKSDNVVLAIFFRILYNIIPTLIFLMGI